MASSLLKILLEITIASSILIVGLLILRRIFFGKINPRLQYALWAIVAIRLLVPMFLSSPITISDINTIPVIKNIQNQTISLLDFTKTNKPISTVESTTLNQEPKYVINNDEKILILYLIGAIGVCFYVIYINLKFGKSIRKDAKLLECTSVIKDAFDSVGIKKEIPVYMSSNIFSPCLMGIFRPRIYITPAALEGDIVLKHVIMHELYHFKQNDILIALLRNICCVIYWFNPLVYMASTYNRKDSELACDSLVISKMAEIEQLEYGNSLIKLVRQRNFKIEALYPATTMTGKKKLMKERILMICNKPKLSILTVLVLIICLIPFVFFGCTSRFKNENITDNLIDTKVVATTIPTSMVTDSNAASGEKQPEYFIAPIDFNVQSIYNNNITDKGLLNLTMGNAENVPSRFVTDDKHGKYGHIESMIIKTTDNFQSVSLKLSNNIDKPSTTFFVELMASVDGDNWTERNGLDNDGKEVYLFGSYMYYRYLITVVVYDLDDSTNINGMELVFKKG